MKMQTVSVRGMTLAMMACLSLAATGEARAAVIIERQLDPEHPNLSELANTDWVLGVSGDGPVYGNRMDGGDGSISTPVFLKGNSQSVNGSSLEFTYDDGIGPESATGTNARGMADDMFSTVGSGFEVDIVGAGMEQTAYFYVAAYGLGERHQFTVLLGEDTYAYDEPEWSAGSIKRPILYTVTFTTPNPGDILTARYELTEISTNEEFGHVLLSAVALHTVPEPSALVLLGLGGLALLPRRRV